MSCWRHDYGHREYVCRCEPPVVGDTGMDDDPETDALRDAGVTSGWDTPPP